MENEINNAPAGGKPPKAKAVTREMARTRAREIAGRAGREPAAVSQQDYEQAKREVTGTSDSVRQEELLAPVPVGPPPL